MALSTKHKYNNPQIASYTIAIMVLLANSYIILFAVETLHYVSECLALIV